MNFPLTFEPSQVFKPIELIDKGLNLHYVFDIQRLPDSVLKVLKEQNKDLSDFKQLILIAHAGKQLWRTVEVCGITSLKTSSKNPIDDFTNISIDTWFNQHHPKMHKKIIYPSSQSIPLQELGLLARWHYRSPFLVGINNLYGSWFAYRSVVLCDSQFSNPVQPKTQSPCESCQTKICISKCPAKAFDASTFNMDACLNYRLKKSSLCQHTCLARIACPVAVNHQYSEEQLHYHYGVSLKMIRNVK